MQGQGFVEGLLDSHPRLYRMLFGLREDAWALFGGFLGGIELYRYKRKYRKRFPLSSVCIGIDPDDRRCEVKVGKYSHSGIIGVGWVPVEGAKYRISIGSYTDINNNVKIILSKAHTLRAVSNNLNKLFLDRRGIDLYRKYHKEEYGNVSIGNDVWIADDVTIIGNVKIGDGAVIGAKSVVTHDIEPYSIAAGAPARTIRYRFGRKTRQKLLRMKWWDWDEERVMKKLELFYDPERFTRNG